MDTVSSAFKISLYLKHYYKVRLDNGEQTDLKVIFCRTSRGKDNADACVALKSRQGAL